MGDRQQPPDWMEYNSLLPQQLEEGSTHPTGKGAVPGTGVGPVRPAGLQVACGPRACPSSVELTDV